MREKKPVKKTGIRKKKFREKLAKTQTDLNPNGKEDFEALLRAAIASPPVDIKIEKPKRGDKKKGWV